MLKLYHALRQVNNNQAINTITTMQGSLRRFRLVRFYLQEKEDPHGTNVSVFISNLPPNLLQRQYERALLRMLGANGDLVLINNNNNNNTIAERPFTKIGPIYYEYGKIIKLNKQIKILNLGSLVLTFDSPKAASAAVLKMQGQTYEDRKLLVMCLPSIQVNNNNKQKLNK
jgi:diacylglycerol kinase (ATP)